MKTWAAFLKLTIGQYLFEMLNLYRDLVSGIKVQARSISSRTASQPLRSAPADNSLIYIKYVVDHSAEAREKTVLRSSCLEFLHTVRY